MSNNRGSVFNAETQRTLRRAVGRRSEAGGSPFDFAQDKQTRPYEDDDRYLPVGRSDSM